MRVLTLYCTIYDFCERNCEGLVGFEGIAAVAFLSFISFWFAVCSGLDLNKGIFQA